MKDKDFKYLVDGFGDIRILRFTVPEFEALTLNQKKYVYYLSEAAKWGRDILWRQQNKHGLVVRKVLENILESYNKKKDSKNYQDFLDYVKRVFTSNDLNHHYSKIKLIPKVSKKYFTSLLDNSEEQGFDLSGKTFDEFKVWIVDIIYENGEKTGDLLEQSDVTFYENVTEEEAKTFYNKFENLKEKEPIQYGLNSKLSKKNGLIFEEIYQENGIHGQEITKIIYFLEQALEFCENKEQEKHTKELIKFYKTGDLRIWDQYSVTWLKENKGQIDYINGFIESYKDPIGIKATFEALVNVRDEKETKITEIIAKNAQWFEDHSPIDEQFKKKDIKGISAKVINAITLGGDCYPIAPIGINLPNSDWIREKHGSKSVSIENFNKALDHASSELPKNIRGEFSYNKENLEESKELNMIGSSMHTHLHECLGHGSGKLLPGVFSTDLKEYQMPIEEARADLFSLYYLPDQKLINLGILPSNDVAKTYYEAFIKNGLQIQLVRIELGKTVNQAHMQGKKLIAELAYEKAKKDKIIEKKIKNNKTYFVVNDFLKLREIFGDILKEVQRIKSEGDYKAAKKLVDNYGTNIDSKLHEETLERFKKLKLKPYTAFINPKLELVTKKSEVIDVKITYPNDFLAQQLEYGREYSL